MLLSRPASSSIVAAAPGPSSCWAIGSGQGRTLFIATHDHGFVTGDDFVLEIRDGWLKGKLPPAPLPTPRFY
jgi:hypothetical protein